MIKSGLVGLSLLKVDKGEGEERGASEAGLGGYPAIQLVVSARAFPRSIQMGSDWVVSGMCRAGRNILVEPWLRKCKQNKRPSSRRWGNGETATLELLKITPYLLKMP
uniref:Uncharacterized protein n=1 Tax=Timema shepardi TaxID=629360 RepID=A0A7R9AXJ2_TIMSH|nr:unnamed protein product [Timema shepardi]